VLFALAYLLTASPSGGWRGCPSRSGERCATEGAADSERPTLRDRAFLQRPAVAGSLSKTDDAEVRVFLVGDAVGCAASGQKVLKGYEHLDRMIESVARHGGDVGCCGTCLDARGIEEDRLTMGPYRS
jgi:DsrE/DsrF-like family